MGYEHIRAVISTAGLVGSIAIAINACYVFHVCKQGADGVGVACSDATVRQVCLSHMIRSLVCVSLNLALFSVALVSIDLTPPYGEDWRELTRIAGIMFVSTTAAISPWFELWHIRRLAMISEHG